jgi:hypothetical protein
MAAGKKSGRKSQASNDFLEPLAVTGLSGTDVGTNRPYAGTANTTSAASAAGTGGAVNLSWSVPALSPVATGYTITTTPSTYTATISAPATSYMFQGLKSDTSYTFTVIATNASGNSTSTTSSSVTATTVPQAPQSLTATAGVNQNTISWTVGANGGKALTKQNVYGSDGTSSGDLSISTTSVTIADTAGTSQTYYGTATNANGTSANSSSSANITTQAPYFPPFFPPFFPFFPFFPYFPYFPGFGPYFPGFGPWFPGFGPYFPPPYFSGVWSDYRTKDIVDSDEEVNDDSEDSI